jgi:hypothetical protein
VSDAYDASGLGGQVNPLFAETQKRKPRAPKENKVPLNSREARIARLFAQRLVKEQPPKPFDFADDEAVSKRFNIPTEALGVDLRTSAGKKLRIGDVAYAEQDYARIKRRTDTLGAKVAELQELLELAADDSNVSPEEFDEVHAVFDDLQVKYKEAEHRLLRAEQAVTFAKANPKSRAGLDPSVSANKARYRQAERREFGEVLTDQQMRYRMHDAAANMVKGLVDNAAPQAVEHVYNEFNPDVLGAWGITEEQARARLQAGDEGLATALGYGKNREGINLRQAIRAKKNFTEFDPTKKEELQILLNRASQGKPGYEPAKVLTWIKMTPEQRAALLTRKKNV